MSIGNHEHKSAEMVILSAVEGGLHINHVSTSPPGLRQSDGAQHDWCGLQLDVC